MAVLAHEPSKPGRLTAPLSMPDRHRAPPYFQLGGQLFAVLGPWRRHGSRALDLLTPLVPRARTHVRCAVHLLGLSVPLK